MTHESRLFNSSNRPVNVYEVDGLLLRLEPGESRTVEAERGLYVPYESAEWKSDDEIVLKPRDNYNDQVLPNTFPLLLHNLADQIVEQRDIPGFGTIWIPRHIPVTLWLPPGHPLIKFAALEIKITERWFESDGFKGHVWNDIGKKDVWIPRSERELEKTMELIDKEVALGNHEA